MKVLVTGATSLIGDGVVSALLARGDEVVTLQRTASAAAFGSGREVDEHLGDIRDRDVVREATRGCDGIIHLAAKVGVVGEWESYRSVNVDGTANVIAAAREFGIPRLVHVSSPSVAHGGEALVGASAETPVLGRKRAWYAESKALAEMDAIAATNDRLGVVAIRPHLVWGPGDTQLVGRIVERAASGRLALVGGGRARVDTTYIATAVDALTAALDAVTPGARCAGRAYVVSNGEPRMIRELVAGICAAAGVEFAPRSVPLRVGRTAGALVERVWPFLRRDDEPPLTEFLAEQLGTAHWFDLRPARDDLDWQPRITIDEGLRRLAASFG
jgi:nucleoside-diphosphate-sugar epimerase